MTDEAALDPTVLASLRALTPPGEPDVLAEILTTFADDVPRRIARLEQAVAAGAAGDAARVAHSMKGSAGNVGARRLQALAHDMEVAARRGDLGALRELSAAIAIEFARVDREIRKVLA